MWATQVYESGSTPVVRYGIGPNNYSLQATGKMDSFYIANAEGTKYHYRVLLEVRKKTKYYHIQGIFLARNITLLMLRLLSSKAPGHKDFWKPSKPCHVGIHWIAQARYCQISTHLTGFQSFSAWFCIGQYKMMLLQILIPTTFNSLSYETCYAYISYALYNYHCKIT